MGQEVKEPNPLLLARNSYPLYEILGALCALNPTFDSQIKLTGTLGASTLESERTEGEHWRDSSASAYPNYGLFHSSGPLFWGDRTFCINLHTQSLCLPPTRDS